MYNIEVTRSKRKTISLKVNEDCRIIVRAPIGCSDKTIKSFIKSKEEWLERAIKKQSERIIPWKGLSDDQIRELKIKAQEYLPGRIEYYSEIMDVRPSGFKITSAKKQFGSCNSANSLCFSYILMLYPEEAIDYVVVHELAHIIHRNHKNAFYKTIEEVLPDYKVRKSLLR